ncbi:MAG: chemotaxis protein CheB [Lachnospiraceae bacterium]|nr:chemotaxis protein CheB [Lachnospiraceae bacterium]
MIKNTKKISDNNDSALMRSAESDIIENTEDSKSFSVSYERIPHKKVPSDSRKLVVICASTGGPKALQTVLTGLPFNINAPVIIVQHMPTGFTASLANRLKAKTGLRVKEAEDGEKLEKGQFYLAKGGKHLKIVRYRGSYKAVLSDDLPKNGLKPCADVLFESLLKVDIDEVVCAVLTGMGKDGTDGIGKLSEKKNVYVIAQDEKTSTVYGMPHAIDAAGITDEVLPLEEIPKAIERVTGTF